MSLPDDTLLSLYRTMCRIRAFEDAAEEASRAGVAVLGQAIGNAAVRGRLHLSTGQRKGGSMHIADFSVGMIGANGVVAAGIPIAVGAAQSLKLRGVDAIAVSFFSDGAINRGPFAEGLHAKTYRLAEARAELARSIETAAAAPWPAPGAAYTDIQDVGAGVWR